jgi:hypothetical protein
MRVLANGSLGKRAKAIPGSERLLRGLFQKRGIHKIPKISGRGVVNATRQESQ